MKRILIIALVAFANNWVIYAQNNDFNITQPKLRKHIEYLASDSLRGRYPGDEGGIKSAEYIHYQLRNYGLNPIAENGYQAFEVVTKCSTGPNNMLTINDTSYTLETDYNPVSFSENANVNAEVVFCGYGIDVSMDSLTWNSYENIEVKGKWVLLLTEDPEPDNMMSEFIPFATARAKITLAKDKGAEGVFLVNGTKASRKDKPMDLTFDQNVSTAGIPVISITRNIANKLLTNYKNIEILEEEIISTKTSQSKELNIEAIATSDVAQTKVMARNIVFETDNNNENSKYIVIGAHFDHLGMGEKGVSSRMPDTIAVHNGADDNASGVSGIIELAGLLQSKANELNHKIIVVAFDAEEMGTLGSKYFVQHSPIPTEQITAMINFDMIGRMKHDTIGITIGGTGTASEFDSLLTVNEPYFKLNFSPDGYGPSDHAPFYSSDIPVLFFTTGAHSDYHTPFDDIEQLDIAKQTDIVSYAAKVIFEIDAIENGITFQNTGTGGKNSRRTRLKVTLGIIPDVAGVVKDGLGIDGVRTGGPADKGGIIKGDKITAINGENVSNIYDYMFRLSKVKAGTTAIVEVERNAEKVVLLIQL